MERDEIETIAAEIMGRAEILSLSTISGEPYPSVRALFNLRSGIQFLGLSSFFADKGMRVYLGTNTSSLKMREIGAGAWVSVYYMIPNDFKGLCLSGRAVADEGAKRSIWIEGWELYYPSGRNDPDYTVLRVDPVRARGLYAGRPFDIELQ